ncbi:MAG: glutamate--tRNA ligase family protein, partial [Anaerovorax sp.]
MSEESKTFRIGPIRPPSEANSLLLQVTSGCTWNKCQFCELYKKSRFKAYSVESIKEDIDAMVFYKEMILEGRAPENLLPQEQNCYYMMENWMAHGGKNVFLQDGNTIALSAERLLQVLEYLREKLPTIERITSYGRAETLSKVSSEQFKALKKAGLDRIHSGFESGSDEVLKLIEKGKAYVCDLSPEEMKATRGTLTEAGKESPNRNRSVDENRALFERMKQGEFEDGALVLRAKIDMSSPNMNMRDPILYRIAHVTHHNTGDKWCIYPMYDYAHPIEDAIEQITHSICTLEFEDHRPLYDWVLKELDWEMPPQQIEFARLNLTNTVMSKRYLKALVDDQEVEGWDDPRMPTLAGLRRRGYTPESIRDFCERIGVSKANSMVDVALLEHCIREDLNPKVESRMVVENPIKI